VEGTVNSRLITGIFGGRDWANTRRPSVTITAIRN